MNKWIWLTLVLFSSALFAEKKPFTIEDLYKMKSVSDVHYSPDGKRIVFTVTSYNLEKGKSNSDLWIMDADGKNKLQLTKNPTADYHPRWHKNGKDILFISTRENGAQAWVINANGGEAGRLTNISTGVGDVEWLGDGDKIVFVSKVFPECGADDNCNSQINEAMKSGPLQAHMGDKLLYRHWTWWQDGRRDHVLMYDPLTDETVDLTPGDFDSPAFQGSFAVSADGKFVAVESNHDENEAETTNKDIFLIDVNSLKSVNITKANRAYDGSPSFSPDGKYIAYTRQIIETYEADRMRLMLYNRKTGKHVTLSEDIDNNVSGINWSPDSKTIYFRLSEEGDYPLFSYVLNSKKITKLIDFHTISSIDIHPSGKKVAFIHRAIAEPMEMFSAPLTGKLTKKYTPLTSFNKTLTEEVDIRPAEEVYIDSPTGKKVHAYLIKPHNFDPSKKYPAIINVHGGPQAKWANSFRGDWQVYPGSGYVLIFPNPHGSTGFGQAYTAAISKDWGGKVYQDVMAVTDYLAALPYVDEERLGAMGWSYGGYMMNWLQGHTTRFKAIVSMMGLYNLNSFYGATEELWFPEWDLGGTPWTSDLYKKWSPDQYVKNFKTPTLIITGERDYRVPYSQSIEFFTALQKRNVDSRLIVFKNDGHWPSHTKSMPFYYNAHLDWFHKYLGGQKAPYNMTKMFRNLAY